MVEFSKRASFSWLEFLIRVSDCKTSETSFIDAYNQFTRFLIRIAIVITLNKPCRLGIVLNFIIVEVYRENDFGTARSLKRNTNWAKTYWKRRDVSDHVCSERVGAFGFAGARQNRNDPDSFVYSLEVGIQSHKFDTMVLYLCAVYELS
jgi:hypothetical protein